MGISIDDLRARYKGDPSLTCYANSKWKTTFCGQVMVDGKQATQAWASVTCPACQERRKSTWRESA